jgi:hypothetical protein
MTVAYEVIHSQRAHVAEGHRRTRFVALLHHSMIRVAAGESGFLISPNRRWTDVARSARRFGVQVRKGWWQANPELMAQIRGTRAEGPSPDKVRKSFKSL